MEVPFSAMILGSSVTASPRQCCTLAAEALLRLMLRLSLSCTAPCRAGRGMLLVPRRSCRSPNRCKELPRKDLTRGSTFFHLADFFRSEALMSALSGKLSICRKMPSACSRGSKVSGKDAHSQAQLASPYSEEQAQAAGKEGAQRS